MSEAASEPRPLLIFLNEVAGGRKLIKAVQERLDSVSSVAVAAPQNQPAAGQLIDAGELRDAARARVEVTMSVLSEYGIDSVGEVMDPHSALALDDAVRAHDPGEVLLSCLDETRFGFTRKDLVEWARKQFEPEVKVTHIPVRIIDDSIRLDVIHTLVVATQTVAAPDLVSRLKQRAAVAAAPLHDRLPADRGRLRARGRPRPRLDPGRALPRRHRRHRPADEPGPVPRRQERDRALPGRRGADLDLQRRAVALARGRPDRPRARDHREAGRAPRGRPRRRGRRRRRRRGGGGADGERIGRPRARPRRGAPRAAGGQPELADRPPDARDLPLHRLRGDAVRRLLRRLLLPPRGRQPADLAAGAVRAPDAGRRLQHRDPRLLELHDPLRAGLDPARQPERAQTRPGPDLDARRDLPLHPDQRVRPHRLQRPRPRLRLDLLLPHRPPRRPRLRRSVPAQPSPRSAPSAATSAPRRRTTSASRCRASTGTSST